MLDMDTVALLDEIQSAERTLGVLDWRTGGRVLDWVTVVLLNGRESAGMEHGGGAGRDTAD